jgi:hypothetical protein
VHDPSGLTADKELSNTYKQESRWATVAQDVAKRKILLLIGMEIRSSSPQTVIRDENGTRLIY